MLLAELGWLSAVLLRELMISQRFFERGEWVILVRESWLLMLRMLTLRMASLLLLMTLLSARVSWLQVRRASLLLDEALRVDQVGVIGLHPLSWLMLLGFLNLCGNWSLLALLGVGSLGLLVLLMSWLLLVFLLGL